MKIYCAEKKKTKKSDFYDNIYSILYKELCVRGQNFMKNACPVR